MVPFYILCCHPSTKNSACLINIQNMWVIVQLDLKAEKFSDTFKVKVLHCRTAYKWLEQSSLISSGLRLHTTSVDEETPDSGTSVTDSCIWHTTKDLVEIRQWVCRTLSIQLLSSPFFPPMRTYVKGETHTYLYRNREEEVSTDHRTWEQYQIKLFCFPFLQEVSPLSSHQMTERSNSKSKTESGVSRVKSFLPVPRSKVTQCSQNTKRSSSSSNTRQIEINNNSRDLEPTQKWTSRKI